MALLRGPPLPLHLTLLPSKKQSPLSSPLLFHAPSNTLTLSPLLGSRSLQPFSLSARSAHAVIQSTSSETERRTRLIAQNVPWTSTLDEVRGLFERYGTVADVEVWQFFFILHILLMWRWILAFILLTVWYVCVVCFFFFLVVGYFLFQAFNA